MPNSINIIIQTTHVSNYLIGKALSFWMCFFFRSVLNQSNRFLYYSPFNTLLITAASSQRKLPLNLLAARTNLTTFCHIGTVTWLCLLPTESKGGPLFDECFFISNWSIKFKSPEQNNMTMISTISRTSNLQSANQFIDFINCLGYKDLCWSSRTFGVTHACGNTRKFVKAIFELKVQSPHSITQRYRLFEWWFFHRKNSLWAHGITFVKWRGSKLIKLRFLLTYPLRISLYIYIHN